MRDPLHAFPVWTKLALLFVATSILAFGVGGYAVTGAARGALVREIAARVEGQSRAWATALDAELRALASRTEDFASDGLLRERAALLLSKDHGGRGDAARELREQLDRKKPLLGVCLGLQLLYQRSEEAPGIEGLAALPGSVSLLPLAPGLKRPHMGWTPVTHSSTHPALAANRSGEAFYFVHSFAALAPDETGARAIHGVPFVAAVARDALVATQFHPEKSQDAGERLLKAWLSL